MPKPHAMITLLAALLLAAPALAAPLDTSKFRSSFNPDTAPRSTQPIGEFPFIQLPPGYQARKSKMMDFARFPFWVGDGAIWVEGKFYQVNFVPASGKEFSDQDVRKDIERKIHQLGGKKVWQGKIPSPFEDGLSDEIDLGFIVGRGDTTNYSFSTYLIRRTEGNIWLHFGTDYSEGTTTRQGWMTVGLEQPFQPSARLLD